MAGEVPIPARPPVPALCFDATGFRHDRDDDPLPAPAPRRGEGVKLAMLAFVLIAATVLPISAAAAGDLWRYLFG